MAPSPLGLFTVSVAAPVEDSLDMDMEMFRPKTVRQEGYPRLFSARRRCPLPVPASWRPRLPTRTLFSFAGPISWGDLLVPVLVFCCRRGSPGQWIQPSRACYRAQHTSGPTQNPRFPPSPTAFSSLLLLLVWVSEDGVLGGCSQAEMERLQERLAKSHVGRGRPLISVAAGCPPLLTTARCYRVQRYLLQEAVCGPITLPWRPATSQCTLQLTRNQGGIPAIARVPRAAKPTPRPPLAARTARPASTPRMCACP
jgi:hypothetical protein